MTTYNEDQKLWNSDRWQRRRTQYRRYKQWYDGVPLNETMDMVDRRTGDKVLKFPLQINLPKLGCDIHRDFARGMPDADSPLIVQATVERNTSERAEVIEDYINDTWRVSYGAAIQQEGMLDMNIYGGAAYILKWTPWSPHLPFRLAVRKIPSPAAIMPTWSQYDPWRMTECYIGFQISREEAMARYNVSVPDSVQDVLYLEYWNKHEWWVHVHGQTPTMKWGEYEWRLRGDNEFGFVPVYYIPHERTTELFGDSAVKGQEELTKDFNSRAANVSDIVRAARPGLLTGHDIQAGAVKVKSIEHNGTVLTHFINLGQTKPVPGAQPPGMDSLPVPAVPDSLIGFPDTLLAWWMMIERVSPACFGLDDTQSGRITGPATAQRMWTSIAHSATERTNYTTGKGLIDQGIVGILKAKKDAYEDLGVPGPDLDDVDPYALRIKQRWPPMIPLDKQQLHEELIDELREGGASIERYLQERGVEDIDGEKKRIMDWLDYLAENEAKSRPTIGGLSGTANPGSDK